ncbi:hypothetical protein Scep_007349 [Stephania cephalantha]|uniref:Uncharacterized protein n=1 Tax=Stephania cephalantha TaxID=152367 RepID=A0AAP0KCC6_9MAGN
MCVTLDPHMSLCNSRQHSELVNLGIKVHQSQVKDNCLYPGNEKSLVNNNDRDDKIQEIRFEPSNSHVRRIHLCEISLLKRSQIKFDLSRVDDVYIRAT